MLLAIALACRPGGTAPLGVPSGSAPREDTAPPAETGDTGTLLVPPSFTEVWRSSIPLSCASSPAVQDVDGDGVRDLVFGYGGEGDEGGAAAYSGASGAVLWDTKLGADQYGSPVLIDVDGDGLGEVFLGGRDGDFHALDGAKGTVLWNYGDVPGNPRPNGTNFHTAVRFELDGVPRLLAGSSGGHDMERPPGRLYLLDPETGAADWMIEDGNGDEVYSTPAVADLDGDGGLEAIYGSGGETLPGRVVSLELDTLTERWSYDGGPFGFMSSPSLADLDGDGGFDVLASGGEGLTVALRGTDGAVLWESRSGTDMYGYGSPALADLDGDGLPEVATTYSSSDSEGQPSPRTDDLAALALHRGRDGAVIGGHSEGFLTMPSPLLADLTGDGVPDALAQFSLPGEGSGRHGALVLFDGVDGTELARLEHDQWMLGTPLLDDLDSDGSADLAICTYSIEGTGGEVVRWSIDRPLPESNFWGMFRGDADRRGVGEGLGR